MARPTMDELRAKRDALEAGAKAREEGQCSECGEMPGECWCLGDCPRCGRDYEVSCSCWDDLIEKVAEIAGIDLEGGDGCDRPATIVHLCLDALHKHLRIQAPGGER